MVRFPVEIICFYRFLFYLSKREKSTKKYFLKHFLRPKKICKNEQNFDSFEPWFSFKVNFELENIENEEKILVGEIFVK